MAQKVGYFENDVVFTEGPFVLVNVGGWRIEVWNGRDTGCNSVVPGASIYRLKEQLGWPVGKMTNTELAERVCNTLNEMVKSGKIELTIRDNGYHCYQWKGRL
jgi:hypothetical protein